MREAYIGKVEKRFGQYRSNVVTLIIEREIIGMITNGRYEVFEVFPVVAETPEYYPREYGVFGNKEDAIKHARRLLKDWAAPEVTAEQLMETGFFACDMIEVELCLIRMNKWSADSNMFCYINRYGDYVAYYRGDVVMSSDRQCYESHYGVFERNMSLASSEWTKVFLLEHCQRWVQHHPDMLLSKDEHDVALEKEPIAAALHSMRKSVELVSEVEMIDGSTYDRLRELDKLTMQGSYECSWYLTDQECVWQRGAPSLTFVGGTYLITGWTAGGTPMHLTSIVMTSEADRELVASLIKVLCRWKARYKEIVDLEVAAGVRCPECRRKKCLTGTHDRLRVS